VNQPPARSLLIRIDPRARAGLQQQVYAGIRRAILEGVAPPGTRLPSSRALATDLGISRTTAVLALEQLVAEGYVTVRRALGSFVVSELPDAMPEPRAAPPPLSPKHPPVSTRGALLGAATPAVRLAGPPRPFRIGVPALDLFPVRIWSQIAGRLLRRVTAAQLDYGEAAGVLALREAIADHVSASRGTRCDADQVFVVAGAQRGIEIVCDLLLDPGDRAWLEHPAYPGARKALLSAGACIVPVRVDGEGLDVDAGARLAGDARLAYVTPSHQFPLGVPMSLARRLALLKWASAARAWVVEDDYDSEFRHGARPIPCLHGLDADGRVIYVGSFSKTLFPALRLGFVIVPPDLRDTLYAARRAADVHPPTLDQAALAEFIADGHFDRHLRRMRCAYTERLEAVVDAVERCCGGALRLRGVSTGLHVAADLEGVEDVRVFREAIDRGVEVMPLSAYSIDEADRPNGLLLGFGGVRPEAARDAMERVAAAIEASRRAS
jgi:GntR family transcriptional regulator/MocR family aminotransferase